MALVNLFIIDQIISAINQLRIQEVLEHVKQKGTDEEKREKEIACKMNDQSSVNHVKEKVAEK